MCLILFDRLALRATVPPSIRPAFKKLLSVHDRLPPKIMDINLLHKSIICKTLSNVEKTIGNHRRIRSAVCVYQHHRNVQTNKPNSEFRQHTVALHESLERMDNCDH